MEPIPFCDGAYLSDSLNISAQRCLNLYPEINQQNSKNPVTLRATPGLKLFTTLAGNETVRGLYQTAGNRLFAVSGATVSEVYADGSKLAIGSLTTQAGMVKMSDNGVDLIILDQVAELGWTVVLSTNIMARITDSTYPGGPDVAFLNQRYIVAKPNTQQYYWSALADGSNWSSGGSGVASAEGSPDNINSLIALGSEVWIFGPQSYQITIQDTGVTMALLQGTNYDVGNAAPNSLSRSDKSLFWLGGDENGNGVVYTNEGYRPRRVSTHAIEQTIQAYEVISDAVGYCYQQHGHEFYVLNFPTARTTWVYDLSTDRWHERNFVRDNNSYMHKGIVQEFFNGKVIVGDWETPNIYELDFDTYTDNGDAIHRERSSPHIWDNLDRAFYGSFQVDVESGVGQTGTGQDSNPQIMLDMSDDGGHDFGSEHWRGAGKIGEYRTRVKWNRLGSSRDRIFRIKMTDPVKWVVLGAYVEVDR